MPGRKMHVTMHPDAAVVQANLRGVAKRLGDLELFYKKASIMLDAWVQRNFKQQGGLLSDGKWKPFAAGGRWTTHQDGSRTFDGSAKLLQDTGDLRKSHAPFFNKHTAGIGSDLPYSKAHHLGLGVPKRRTLPNAGEVNDALFKLLEQHAARAAQ